MTVAIYWSALAFAAGLALQGCGGGGPSPPSPPGPTPSPTPPPPGPPLPEFPIQGICYAPLACDVEKGVTKSCAAIGQTGEDMAQPGYKAQWGTPGRDDLGIMRRMGANAIRLYHPIGIEKGVQPNHGEFLDAAQTSGLHVLGSVHQYLECPNDDCFQSWHDAVLGGFNAGFAVKGKWHPAVWTINLINEVDILLPGPKPWENAKSQVKRVISAVDGLLAAEEKALGARGGVNLTSCFSTAMASPLGGGPETVYHGFSSIEAWIKDTSLVDYKVRSSVNTSKNLAAEIDKRWIHCLNAQIPWTGTPLEKTGEEYAQFMPRPWIMGEMGWQGIHNDVIKSEITKMTTLAKQGKGFAGTFVFQFQTAYQKGGAEMNFGMFGLGNKTTGHQTQVAGRNYSVQCLTSRLFAFEEASAGCKEDCNHRAEAVAEVFGGQLSGESLCLDSPPAGPIPPPNAGVVTI